MKLSMLSEDILFIIYKFKHEMEMRDILFDFSYYQMSRRSEYRIVGCKFVHKDPHIAESVRLYIPKLVPNFFLRRIGANCLALEFGAIISMYERHGVYIIRYHPADCTCPPEFNVAFCS